MFKQIGYWNFLRVSSPFEGVAWNHARAPRVRVLSRLASLVKIGELARRLVSFKNSFNAHCALSVTRISFTYETHLTSFKSSKVSSFKGQLFFSAAWTAAPERLWASRKGTWKDTANVLRGCTTLQLTELWEEHYSNWVFNFRRQLFGIVTTLIKHKTSKSRQLRFAGAVQLTFPRLTPVALWDWLAYPERTR